MRSAMAAQASRVCSGAIKRRDSNSSWMTLQSGRVAGCAAKRPQPCGPAASACEAPPFALRDLIRSVAASAFYGPSAPSLHPLKGTQRFNLDPNGWLSLPDNRLRNTALRANPCERRRLASATCHVPTQARDRPATRCSRYYQSGNKDRTGGAENNEDGNDI